MHGVEAIYILTRLILVLALRLQIANRRKRLELRASDCVGILTIRQPNGSMTVLKNPRRCFWRVGGRTHMSGRDWYCQVGHRAPSRLLSLVHSQSYRAVVVGYTSGYHQCYRKLAI
jgi:hypothetical protein